MNIGIPELIAIVSSVFALASFSFSFTKMGEIELLLEKAGHLTDVKLFNLEKRIQELESHAKQTATVVREMERKSREG